MFDKNYIYISGDLGEAIFELTERAELNKVANYNLGYLVGKLAAFWYDKYDFARSKARDRLIEWEKELNEGEIEYDKEVIHNLMSEADGCCNVKHWHAVVNMHSDEISEFEEDQYWSVMKYQLLWKLFISDLKWRMSN